MRLSNLFQSKKTLKNSVACHESKRRIARFETLERRELLALSTTTADYRSLVAASSLNQTEDSAIWVTSLDDVTNVNDGKITLREAIDYATQKLSTGETVSSTIKFSIGGTVTLSSSNQSLKVLSKSINIDASDVGGVTIQGKNSLLLYVFGGTAVSPASVSLTNLTLTNGQTTTANAKGSAIQLNQHCNLTASNCSIVNNTSTSGLGTGVYVGAGSLTLIDSLVMGNTSSSSQSIGGAVYVDSGVFTAINTTFANNSSGLGGAVYAKSGTVTLNGCTFRNNIASDGDGGAIYATATTLTVDGSGFTNNTSAESGGAIYVDGEEEISLNNVRFHNNSGVNGGAIYQDTESLSVENAVFSNNSATQNGGAIYMGLNSGAQITSGIFEQNTASINGGAIYSDGSLFLTLGEFSSNEAGKNGGAISSTYYYEIRDIDFDQNQAQNFGGAIYGKNEMSSWVLRVNVENSSAQEGAAIFNEGKLSVVDSTFSQNTALKNGGGLVNLGTLFLAQSEISNNTALGLNGAGGGILNYPNASITIACSKLSANTASDGSGGALANNGTAHLDSVTVDSNIAGEFGGGVYNGGTLTAANSDLSYNKANNGGALAVTYGSSVSLTSSTLWHNEAILNGGALYTYGSASFQSSTLSYNTASTASVAAYYCSEDATSTPSFDSSTVLTHNVANSEIQIKENRNIVLFDSENYELIENGIYFGDVTTIDDSIMKTVTIKNTSATSFKFSDFVVTSNSDSQIFEYFAATPENEKINLNESFILRPYESIYLTIVATPGKVGAKIMDLSWTTIAISDEERPLLEPAQFFAVQSIVNVTKQASISKSVTTLPDSDANISFNENGSFSLTLQKAPTENVIIYLKSSDAVELSTDVLLFTPSNYNVAQTITATINHDYYRNFGNIPSEIEIRPQIISSPASWNGTTCSSIELKVKEHIGFIDDNYVDLNEHATEGTTRWDLNNDGYADVISYGEPLWINSSVVLADKIVSMQTRNGVTTTKEFDAPVLDPVPSVQGDLTIFNTIPGMVRLSLESLNSVITNWRIDWGDGSGLSSSDATSMAQDFSHCYAEDGQYVVSIEIIDANNQGVGIWSSIGSVSINNIGTSSNAFVDAIEEFSELVDTSENPALISADLIAQSLLEQSRKHCFNNKRQ